MEKSEIIKTYARHEGDTGSPEVQSRRARLFLQRRGVALPARMRAMARGHERRNEEREK